MVTVVGQQEPAHGASTDDQRWMQLALAQAHQAARQGEVPVGAVVVGPNGQLLATGHNSPIATHDPTGHAELVALRTAAQALGNYRLEGCTLYVTLEPCAMCSGAMLHARLARVVFGAPDAKTGAAGSVLNLFALPALNHRTQLQGGVLPDACAQVLKAFFAPRRANTNPLREDALRTPEARFAHLPPLPGTRHWVADLPALAGLRLHYLDEAPPDRPPAPLVVLCVHATGAWAWAYRHLLPALVGQGLRVLVPDLIGFGQSDKPKKEHAHTLAWHAQVLVELLQHAGVQNVLLVLPADGAVAALGSALAMAWQHTCPHGWLGAVNCLAPSTPEVAGLARSTTPGLPAHAADAQPEAWAAPFPDNGFCAAPRAFARFPHTAPNLAHMHALHSPALHQGLPADVGTPAGAQLAAQHIVQLLRLAGQCP